MVINLDGFEAIHEGKLQKVWSDGKGSYVVTDKKGELKDSLYMGKNGVNKESVLRVLINEYAGTENEEKLRRIAGEVIPRKKASGEA